MLNYVIEGFLMESEMSGYDINRKIKDYQLLKSSYGNIYPALKRLETAGSIHVKEIVEAGRFKKLYTINEKGKKEFIEWLEQPILIGKSNDEHLIKLVFYNYLPKEKVIYLLADFLKNINRTIRSLKAFKAVLSKYARKEDYFQLAYLQYGIDHLHFINDWYQRLLQDLERKTGD